MAQLHKHLVFDFCSGHDLKVEMEPHGACLGFSPIFPSKKKM